MTWPSRGERRLAGARQAAAGRNGRCAAGRACEEGMVRLLLMPGIRGVRPSDIVGAIANEAGIPGRVIGAIDIYDEFTLVDMPAEYKRQVLGAMAGARLRNQPVSIRVARPGIEKTSTRLQLPQSAAYTGSQAHGATRPAHKACGTAGRQSGARPGAAAAGKSERAS